MTDDANPHKRLRVDEIAELRLTIIERDKAYEDLSQKFQMLIEKNINLQRSLDTLMEQNSQLSAEEYGSEEDMVLEEHIPKSEKQKKKKSSSKSKNNNKSQAKAVAGKNITEGSKGAIPKTLQHGAARDQAEGADDGASANIDMIDETAAAVTGVHQTQQTNGKLSKSKHIPVITCYNINIKQMTNIIDKGLGHKNYTLKIMGRNATNIGVCTIIDFEKVKTLLKAQRVNYYTYTPKGQRPLSLVIGGLSGTYTVEDIRDHLDGINIKLDILGLTQLGGDKWLLRLSRESDINAFLQVRYILRCRVSMRKFKRGAITQCFNCQRFGHISANCEMPFRCVKCGASHGPGKCDIPAKGDNIAETLVTDPLTGTVTRKVGLPVRCANCNVEGHVASSKECPRRIQLANKINAKRATQVQTPNPRTFVSSGVRNGVSYATAAAAASSPPKTQQASKNISLKDAMAQFQMLDIDCKRFFGGGLLSCFNKIGGFAREYANLNNDDSKFQAMLGLLMTLRHDG